jgi:IS1 family transposase
LKQKFERRQATTLDGLWKVLNDEWSKIPVTLVGKVYESWKKRCRAVHKNHGYHIEKTNHNKKIRI